MPDRKDCKARRINDELQCFECGLVWDYKDEDPPECRPDRRVPESTPATGRKVVVVEQPIGKREDPLQKKLGRKVPDEFKELQDKVCQQNAERMGHGIDKKLDCPECGEPHIDRRKWRNEILHKTHLCEYCGHTWRPFNYPTRGV